MILIWDNGEAYSNHDIDFLELGDVPLEHAVELLRMRDDGGYVLATAERLEWRASGSIGNLFDRVSPRFELSKAGDIPRALCLRILDHEENRLRTMLAEIAPGDRWSASRSENIKRSLAEVGDARVALAARTRD